MRDWYRKMQSGDDKDSPGKCRERRRRRIETRRLTSVPNAGLLPEAQTSENQMENSSYVFNEETIETTTGPVSLWMATTSISSGEDAQAQRVLELPRRPPLDVPAFGTMSVAGRSRDMEDAIAVYTSLCTPEINLRRPVHFFAVYDGHGGSHVAALCRGRMHVLLEDELMRVDHTDNCESGVGRSSSSEQRELQRQQLELEEGWKEKWTRVLKRSFEKLDEEALNTCICGCNGFHCGRHPMEMALEGSTAAVAVLTPEQIIVANCGDSRAVLCRGGGAIPLSFDHKPDRADELARIRAAGGQVIYIDGARVEGILAMSRTIGDKFLKPVVTSEPEISFTKREAEDECLIIASDGLWDVITNELACEIASECMREGNPPTGMEAEAQVEDEVGGTLYPSRSVLAAALLTRLALGRGSSDNISVIVADLKCCWGL